MRSGTPQGAGPASGVDWSEVMQRDRPPAAKLAGGRRPRTGLSQPTSITEAAECRWRLARAEREELAVGKMRGELIELSVVLRSGVGRDGTLARRPRSGGTLGLAASSHHAVGR